VSRQPSSIAAEPWAARRNAPNYRDKLARGYVEIRNVSAFPARPSTGAAAPPKRHPHPPSTKGPASPTTAAHGRDHVALMVL